MTCTVEIIDNKNISSQLGTSKSSIKKLFNNILDETKDFKYQITVNSLLKNAKALKLNFVQFISVQQKNSDKS